MKRTRFWLWSGIASAAFLFVWQQMQSVRLGYELENTRRQVQSQRDQNAYLRLEVERLLSPASLAQVAQQHLHMKPPAPESLVVLDRRPPSLASRRAPVALVKKT